MCTVFGKRILLKNQLDGFLSGGLLSVHCKETCMNESIVAKQPTVTGKLKPKQITAIPTLFTLM